MLSLDNTVFWLPDPLAGWWAGASCPSPRTLRPVLGPSELGPRASVVRAVLARVRPLSLVHSPW